MELKLNKAAVSWASWRHLTPWHQDTKRVTSWRVTQWRCSSCCVSHPHPSWWRWSFDHLGNNDNDLMMMVRGPQTVWKCWQWARAERGWRWRGEHTGCQCQGSDIRQIKFLAPSWILFTLCPIYINIRAKAAPATPPRQFVWGTFWQFWFDYIENSGHHSPAPVPGPSLYIINLHILGWQPQCHIFSHYDTFPLKPQNKSDTFTINMTLMGRHGCSEWRQETEF